MILVGTLGFIDLLLWHHAPTASLQAAAMLGAALFAAAGFAGLVLVERATNGGKPRAE